MTSLCLLLMWSVLKTTEMKFSLKKIKKKNNEVRIYPVLHLVDRHESYVNHLISSAQHARESVFIFCSLEVKE